MPKKHITTMVTVVTIFAMPIFIIFHYFGFIYFNENEKKNICENLDGIASVEMITKLYNDKYIKKSIVIDDPNFIQSFRNKLITNCENSYDKYLVARYATSIIRCKISGESELYLRVVKLRSGISFIDFHRGGFFSLIGTVKDTFGLYELISEKMESKTWFEPSLVSIGSTEQLLQLGF